MYHLGKNKDLAIEGASCTACSWTGTRQDLPVYGKCPDCGKQEVRYYYDASRTLKADR